MTSRARRPYRKLFRRGFVAAGLVAVVLGLWQFGISTPDPAADHAWVRWFNAALKTWQLFVLQIAPTDLKCWQGRVAAVLAPTATAGAILLTFWDRLVRRWQLTQLLWSPASDVFLGGGETATGIAARRGGKVKIVGLDCQAEPPLAYVMDTSALPGFMHAGDALSLDDLKELKLHRARNVWINTGDDLRNIEIARRICTLLRSAPRQPAAPVRLFVHVFDTRIARSLDSLFPGLDPAVVVLELYAIARLAARTVLQQHPPRWTQGQPAPHLLIMGGGKLAAALALHAVQHCVYAEDPATSVRVTLVGTDSAELLKQLRQQFAALNDSADPALQPMLPLAQLAAIECAESELSAFDWQRAQQDGRQPFSAVYATRADDAGTLRAALRAVALREIAPDADDELLPIVACFQQAPGTEGALTEAGGTGPRFVAALQNAKALTAFGVFEQCIGPDEDYPGERQDRRALLIHAAYNDVLVPDSPSQPVDDAMRQRWIVTARALWRKETEKSAYRWSSRLCADHIALKLANLAGRFAPVVRADDVQGRLADHATVMALARLEHRRFVVERLLEGWLPLPSPMRGSEHSPSGLSLAAQKQYLLLNHTLVPFDQLGTIDAEVNQAQKDVAIVRAIPEILRCERLMDDQGQGAA